MAAAPAAAEPGDTEEVALIRVRIASAEALYETAKHDRTDPTFASTLLAKIRRGKEEIEQIEEAAAAAAASTEGAGEPNEWRELNNEHRKNQAKEANATKNAEASAKKLEAIRKRCEAELRSAQGEADTDAKIAAEAVENSKASASKVAAYKAPPIEHINEESDDEDDEDDKEAATAAAAAATQHQQAMAQYQQHCQQQSEQLQAMHQQMVQLQEFMALCELAGP